MTLLVVTLHALRYGTYPNPTLLLGSIYWGTLNVALLGTFVSRSWHGLKLASRLFNRRQGTALARA